LAARASLLALACAPFVRGALQVCYCWGRSAAKANGNGAAARRQGGDRELSQAGATGVAALVTGIHLHHVVLQCRLALRAAVEHVAARVLFYLDALCVAHHGHLVDDQYRGHEGA
jgi:hypothetical protein